MAGGLVLIALLSWFEFDRGVRFAQLAIFYGFGLLFLYSSLYSFMADQVLVVDGTNRSLHFHKRNLYGRVEWDRGGDQFTDIRVFRPGRIESASASNWSIMLVASDGLRLFLGENEFGALSRKRAMALAENVGRLTGIETTAETA